MLRLLLVASATIALGSAIAGCGGVKSSADPSDPAQVQAGSGGGELSANDAETIQEAQQQIDTACGLPTDAPDPQEIPGAVTSLLGVLRESPDEIYETGNVDRAEKVSDVAKDTVKLLRQCRQTAQAARLQRAVG